MNSKLFVIALATFFSLSIFSNESAPSFSLLGSDGKTHKLSDYKGKLVVLEWFNHGCPFVRKHYDSQNMQRLQSLYKKKGVVWLTLVSSAKGKQGHTDLEAANSVRKDEGMKSLATLLDTDGKIGKLYDAKTTPHMYIIDKQGKLAYNGAIDNRPSTKASDIPNSINYVRENLDLLLVDKSPKYAKTKPYGCSVKY